jgi:hypothetical protein
MPALKFGKSDFEEFMRRQWAAKGIDLGEEERVGVAVHELVAESVERNAKRELPYLELWVAILDEFVSWLISLLTVFYAHRKGRGGNFTNFDKSVFLVLTKIIADATAMRHLILLGFDTSARTILRSSAEYMDVLVALLHDPSLAEHFVLSDTPEGAKEFWQEHLRSGRIRRRVRAAWHDFFQTSPQDQIVNSIANWTLESQELLSGLLHPSVAGGIFTAIPLKTIHVEENWLGLWGDKADMSVETISMYVHFMWPILLLSRGFPFEGFDGWMSEPIPYDKTNELHRHVKLGRDILASFVLSIGSESNSHIFPEIDMSVWHQPTT